MEIKKIYCEKCKSEKISLKLMKCENCGADITDEYIQGLLTKEYLKKGEKVVVICMKSVEGTDVTVGKEYEVFDIDEGEEFPYHIVDDKGQALFVKIGDDYCEGIFKIKQ